MVSAKQTEIKFFNIKSASKNRLSASPGYDSQNSDGEHKVSGADDNMFQTMPVGKQIQSIKRKFQTTSMPQSNSKPELGWVSNKKPPIQSKSKIELVRQTSPTQLMRSSSAQNLIRVKPRDVEDLKHSLHRLKIDFN